ncbi:MAG: rRNA maturation RNase YbeY [Enhygromyxa sp.]
MLCTPRFQVSPALAGRVDPRLLALLGRRLRRAAQRLRVDPRAFASLGLRIVDDAEMARLHLEFMGEPGPTDVLSFTPEAPYKSDESDEFDRPGLGDLVLDWDAVERQARDRSAAALLDEATVLLVHGLAHLHGHDHRTRAEGRAMHALERRLLRALRTPDPPRPYAPWTGGRGEGGHA